MGALGWGAGFGPWISPSHPNPASRGTAARPGKGCAMGIISRTYKDSLFCRLFGDEGMKENALDLYNALSGKSLSNPDELELYTIDDAVFLGRKNDVAYLVGDEMLLWEHQSTRNPNMPLRGLLYFARLFTKLIEVDELDLYGTALLALPTPRYVVFYFGEAELPEREEMALSESFAAGPGDVEVTATVLNCNEGHNAAIMRACSALRGYARLVALERANRKRGMAMRDAARAAVDQCIVEDLLADYLVGHRAEVEDMLFTMQDEERAMRVHYKAIEREAREQGMQQGRTDTLLELVQEGSLSAEQAASKLGVTEERLSEMLGQP